MKFPTYKDNNKELSTEDVRKVIAGNVVYRCNPAHVLNVGVLFFAKYSNYNKGI